MDDAEVVVACQRCGRTNIQVFGGWLLLCSRCIDKENAYWHEEERHARRMRVRSRALARRRRVSS